MVRWKKSLCTAYFLWLFGGFCGLHHVYLRRYRHALAWWCLPGGYFGAGWFRDLWRIPEYVREANNDPQYLRDLSKRMRESSKPPLSMVRFIGEVVMGNMFGFLAVVAIPNNDYTGTRLEWLGLVTGPLGTAIGIWLVGNIGRHQGSIVPPLLACFLLSPLQYWGRSNPLVTSVLGAAVFEKWSKKWRRRVMNPDSTCQSLTILVVCCSLYSSLWLSYAYFNVRISTKHGEEVYAREAIRHFLKSPAFQQFRKNVQFLWDHAWQYGLFSAIDALIESLDPLGEADALKVLGLPPEATIEEIRKRYQELIKTWHPDKHQHTAEKEEAQKRFIEIREAYQNLWKIHTQRSARNVKPVPSDHE